MEVKNLENIVKKIKEILLTEETNPGNIEGLYNCLVYNCVYDIQSKDRDQLTKSFKSLKDLYDELYINFKMAGNGSNEALKDIETRKSYYLGRIATILDIITTALLNLGPKAFDELIKQSEYRLMLSYIYNDKKDTKNSLKRYLSLKEREVIQKLTKLEQASLIITRPIGNDDLFLELSLAAREVSDIWSHSEDVSISLLAMNSSEKKKKEKDAKVRDAGKTLLATSELRKKLRESYVPIAV